MNQWLNPKRFPVYEKCCILLNIERMSPDLSEVIMIGRLIYFDEVELMETAIGWYENDWSVRWVNQRLWATPLHVLVEQMKQNQDRRVALHPPQFVARQLDVQPPQMPSHLADLKSQAFATLVVTRPLRGTPAVKSGALPQAVVDRIGQLEFEIPMRKKTQSSSCSKAEAEVVGSEAHSSAAVEAVDSEVRLVFPQQYAKMSIAERRAGRPEVAQPIRQVRVEVRLPPQFQPEPILLMWTLWRIQSTSLFLNLVTLEFDFL